MSQARDSNVLPRAPRGTILVSDLVSGNGTYVAAMIVLAAVAVVGLGVAFMLPANPLNAPESAVAPATATPPGAIDTSYG